MATFEAQVESLASISIDGSSTPTQAELTQFLTDGAKEIINSLPKSLLEKCASVDTLDNSTTTLTSINRKGIILNVLRDEGNGANDIGQPCRYVASHLRGKIQDSSEMDFATSTDPAYLIYNNALEVYPTPTATQQAFVYYVNYPEVSYSDSDISSLVLTGVTATNADPSVFTKSSHGLSTGDKVRLSGFNEMTELNGMVGTVNNSISANQFLIDGISGDPAETTGGQVSRLGGFPSEAEYLVVIYATIKSLEALYSGEEDIELYIPIINQLKEDYKSGLAQLVR